MKKVAVIGTPEPSVLARYAGWDFIDLDIDADAQLSIAEEYIPKVYCAILKTVLSNALFYRDEIECVIAEVGEAKCDGARMICRIIADETGLPVIETRQDGRKATAGERYMAAPTPISDSDLALDDKLSLIMDEYIAHGLKVPGHKNMPEHRVLAPDDFAVGFWGVPPSDFSLLQLFPHNTKVLGWTRSVEARVPWSLDYEMSIPKGLPVVFFAQSFCQKGSLARYLADKHNGLYVDADDKASASVKAKLEAFLQLAAGVKK